MCSKDVDPYVSSFVRKMSRSQWRRSSTKRLMLSDMSAYSRFHSHKTRGALQMAESGIAAELHQALMDLHLA